MLNCTRGLIVAGIGLLAPLSLAADRPAYSQPAQPAPTAQPQRPGQPAPPQRPAPPLQPASPMQQPVLNAAATPATQPAVQHDQLAEHDAAALGKLARAKSDSNAKGKPLTDALTAKLNEIKRTAAAKAKVAANARTPARPPAPAAVQTARSAPSPMTNGLTEADYVAIGQFVADKIADNVTGDALAEAVKNEIKDRRAVHQQEIQAAQAAAAQAAANRRGIQDNSRNDSRVPLSDEEIQRERERNDDSVNVQRGGQRPGGGYGRNR